MIAVGTDILNFERVEDVVERQGDRFCRTYSDTRRTGGIRGECPPDQSAGKALRCQRGGSQVTWNWHWAGC